MVVTKHTQRHFPKWGPPNKPGAWQFWPDLCWIQVLLWQSFADFSALCILQQPPLRWFTKTLKPCKNARSHLVDLYNALFGPFSRLKLHKPVFDRHFCQLFPKQKLGPSQAKCPFQLKLYCLQVDLVRPELLMIMPGTFGVGGFTISTGLTDSVHQ